MRPASRVACRWRVVEIGRHGDDGLGRVAGPAAHFAQDQGRQFFRRVLVAGDADVQHLAAALGLALDDLMRDERQFALQVGERPAHEPLDAEDGVLGIAQAPARAPPCRRARSRRRES